MEDGSGGADDAARARLGTVLRGKYRLDRVLGQGGMATVYRATHRNQAEFAVKILHPELSRDADIRGRFLREGYAANSVKHAGVVRVVDDDVAEDGAAFLVMELLEDGTSCDVLLAKRPFSVEAASAVTLQTLEVLSAAHAKGILHRDIKPANLFVTRTGLIKVLDFGIARARDALSGHHTTTGVLLGTPAFMAPEQALAKTREMDGRTDLWAVAATFFILVSGRPVHEAETNAELAVMAATQRARPLRSAAPKVPPEMCKIIDRGLAFDRKARWPDADAMRSALEAAHRSQFGEPTHRCVASVFDVAPTVRLGVASVSPAPTPASDAPSSASLQPPEATTAQPLSRVPPRSTTPRRWVVVGGIGAGCLLVLAGAASLRRGSASAPAPAPIALTRPVAAQPPPAPSDVSAVTAAPSTARDSAVTAPAPVSPPTAASMAEERAPTRRSAPMSHAEAPAAPAPTPHAPAAARKQNAAAVAAEDDDPVAGSSTPGPTTIPTPPTSVVPDAQPPPPAKRPCVVPTMSACLWHQNSICIEACKEYNGKTLDECSGPCLPSDPSNEANWIPLCRHEIEEAQKSCGTSSPAPR